MKNKGKSNQEVPEEYVASAYCHRSTNTFVVRIVLSDISTGRTRARAVLRVAFRLYLHRPSSYWRLESEDSGVECQHDRQ